MLAGEYLGQTLWCSRGIEKGWPGELSTTFTLPQPPTSFIPGPSRCSHRMERSPLSMSRNRLLREALVQPSNLGAPHMLSAPFGPILSFSWAFLTHCETAATTGTSSPPDISLTHMHTLNDPAVRMGMCPPVA